MRRVFRGLGRVFVPCPSSLARGGAVSKICAILWAGTVFVSPDIAYGEAEY